MCDNLIHRGRPPEEVVLTYRQRENLVRPVVLRYERELPPCMREEEPQALPPRQAAIAPQEKKKRWGVRLFVGVSLLVSLVCLGTGIWYVGQYGWALPQASQAPDNRNIPPEEDYFYFDQGPENKEISIRRYPTGGA